MANLLEQRRALARDVLREHQTWTFTAVDQPAQAFFALNQRQVSQVLAVVGHTRKWGAQTRCPTRDRVRVPRSVIACPSQFH